MACNCPIDGFRGADGRFVSVRAKSPSGVPMQIPCGQCMGCRIDKKLEWSTRIDLEASAYEADCVVFGTSTYAPGLLPPDGGLRLSDMSKAVRMLRQEVRRYCKREGLPLAKIRFFLVGEYGDEDGRPHYHFILYGWNFPDKIASGSVGGETYYKSDLLSRCWPHGFIDFAPVRGPASGYVAKYTTKKITGSAADDFYLRPHPETGELFRVEPESSRVSRRPGLGSAWFDKYSGDCFPKGFLTKDGVKIPVPRAFKRKLKGRAELEGSSLSDALVVRDDSAIMRRKGAAKTRTAQFVANNSPDRRKARELIARERSKNAGHLRVIRDLKSKGRGNV